MTIWGHPGVHSELMVKFTTDCTALEQKAHVTKSELETIQIIANLFIEAHPMGATDAMIYCYIAENLSHTSKRSHLLSFFETVRVLVNTRPAMRKKLYTLIGEKMEAPKNTDFYGELAFTGIRKMPLTQEEKLDALHTFLQELSPFFAKQSKG